MLGLTVGATRDVAEGLARGVDGSGARCSARSRSPWGCGIATDVADDDVVVEGSEQTTVRMSSRFCCCSASRMELDGEGGCDCRGRAGLLLGAEDSTPRRELVA